LRLELAERSRAEEQMREQAALLDKATDAILVGDVNGRILYINPSAETLYGWTFAELATWQGDAPIYKDPSQFHAAMRIVLERGDWRGDLAHVTRDGRELIMESRWTLLKNSEGQPKSILFINTDITERKEAEAALAEMNDQLREASRQAGIAEVVTGVLHNVGNVLNSVNVSANLVSEQVRKSPAADLSRVVALLREQGSNLGEFFTNDPRGPKVPDFLAQLAETYTRQQKAQLEEVASLQKNVEHIKDIVAMQQSYAKVSGVTDNLSPAELIQDALRMNAGSFQKHRIELVLELPASLPTVRVEKHKVLQILVNLLRNAEHACIDANRTDKRITLRATEEDATVRITVSDTGVGIPAENLNRIFNHGFTTKKNGHGFGLHSGANAAKEMGGSLTVHSDGPGCGASFMLELPVTAVDLAAATPSGSAGHRVSATTQDRSSAYPLRA
jgi:PAS domain S-box-containing protein